MNNLSAHAKELLAIQQQKYVGSLPTKHANIRRCWENIQREGLSSANTEMLRLHVHRLAGSAGSYGLHGLGKAAKELDLALGSGDHNALSNQEIAKPIAELLSQFDQLDF